MPMNDAVREMLPEKRRIWILRYSRSNDSRASRKRAAHDRHGRACAAHRALVVEDLGREQIDFDARHAVAGREDQSPFDDVSQLANVAGPIVRLERGHRLFRNARRRHRVARRRSARGNG